MALPAFAFGLVPITGDGMPSRDDASYRMQLDQAVSGGSGTADYLSAVASLADFTQYLQQKGADAFTEQQSTTGSMQAVATDGTRTMQVAVRLNPGLTQTTVAGVPVRGIATVQLSLPAPRELAKIISFGLSLAEIPAGMVVTDALISALFRPLLQQLTTFVRTAVDSWLEIEIGEDVDGLGEEIASAAGDAAEEVGADTAEVVVEEAAVAELAIDLSAAVPAFAVLGVLIAVPLLVMSLSKQFELHLEIDNQTDSDFSWSTPYVYNGAMTAQPAVSVLPRTGRAVDAWGDVTDVPVVYQANFSAMNRSGYEGTGLALLLSPAGLTDQDIGVLVSIPWAEDNGLWLGEVPSGFDWEQAFDDLPECQLRVSHGNQKFYATIAIDALSGNSDRYHCVLRIQSL
jgi:hypothetical protein